MVGIPPPLDSDAEDVAWALQTAEALWKRNERADAVVWLRRAAQAAGEANDDDRALVLARDAAELTDWISRGRATPPPPSADVPIDDADVSQEEDTHEHEQVTHDLDRIPLESERLDEPPTVPPDQLASTPRAPATRAFVSERPTNPYGVPSEEDVRPAAEKHAGMLDPWADADSPTGIREHAPPRSAPPQNEPPGAASATFDRDEIVTSAPVIARSERAPSPASKSSPTPPPPRPPRPPSIDLDGVDALADLPDDARAAFASTAVVRDLTRDEEVTGFALALVVEGSVDLAATLVDSRARRLETGAVVRSRATIEHVTRVRLLAGSGPARLATWDERAVGEAFRSCPWVEHELRAAADRLHAEVGVTLGPLGERLDPVLREGVVAKLTLRVLGELEVFATRGKPIPGLLVVGAGQLEFVGDAGNPLLGGLRPGDFLFPNEVLRAAPAPATVRAAKGGALVLTAPRGAAQELLVTCPPLLEIFAGG
jgi:hypothetical protein